MRDKEMGWNSLPLWKRVVHSKGRIFPSTRVLLLHLFLSPSPSSSPASSGYHEMDTDVCFWIWFVICPRSYCETDPQIVVNKKDDDNLLENYKVLHGQPFFYIKRNGSSVRWKDSEELTTISNFKVNQFVKSRFTSINSSLLLFSRWYFYHCNIKINPQPLLWYFVRHLKHRGIIKTMIIIIATSPR